MGKPMKLTSAASKSGAMRIRTAKTGRLISKVGKRDSPFVNETVQKRVSASVLHRDTRPTLDLLQTSDAVAVTHYNEIEGFLVAPQVFVGLVERADEALARETELASTVTVLLAAARTGVPIPSDMLERVMPNVDVAQRWREIAEFAATLPVRITAGEEGEILTRARVSHVGGLIEESGSDDDLDLG